MARVESMYPSVDVNRLIQKIVKSELLLPDPRNVCCSPVFYQDWAATHSGLSEAPLMFVKGIKRSEL